MYLKNISNENIMIGGALLAAGVSKPLDDIGSKEVIRNYAETILQGIYNGTIEVRYPDGSIEDRLTSINTLLMQGFVGVAINQTQKNYYFLKDTFKMKKGEEVEKYFLGKMTSMTVTTSSNDVNVTVKTNQGLELPADKIVKNQTLEFDFAEGMMNPEIEIEAEATTEVTIFIEGYDEQTPTQELQRFIRTWYQDTANWKTTKPVIGPNKFNSSVHQEPKTTDDDVNGHTLRIYADKAPAANQEYVIYEVKDGKEWAVELLTDNVWNPFDPDRFHLHISNCKYIQFDDQTVDLTTATLADYNTHSTTKYQD